MERASEGKQQVQTDAYLSVYPAQQVLKASRAVTAHPPHWLLCARDGVLWEEALRSGLC